MRRLRKSVVSMMGAVLVVGATLVAVAPAASAAGTAFTNGGSITLNDPSGSGPAEANPYPSSIAVSGQTGTVSSLTVTLSGIDYSFSQDIGALLVGPTGKALVLFSSVGSNSQTTATSGLNVTLDDSSSTTFPYNTALPTSGSVTMKPADDTADNFPGIAADVFPAPAPAGPFGHAAPTGSDTLGSVFDGTNPNGTWSLYLTTDAPGDGTGSIAGGWSLNVTTSATLSATTTTVSSDNNPSFASAPGNSVTFTAAVAASGTPVTTGTVGFTDGGTTISGCGAAVLDASGRATCTAAFTTEGNHPILATYSGTSSEVTSAASLGQVVNNHTVVTGSTYSNPGTITIPNTAVIPGPATPYPSDVFVSGLSGQVSHLSVTLNGISDPFSQDLNALLVGPSGQTLILLGNVGPSTGTTNASNVTVTFDDNAASTIPQGTPLGSPGSIVTTKPVDYAATDQFPIPAPAGPYGTPAPAGTGSLGLAFDGTNPNGTWRLFVVTDGGAVSSSGAVAGGWSLNVTTATLAATTTSVTSNNNPSFTAAPGNAVTFTATVVSGGPVTTGTVSFTANGTPISGCTAVTISGSGQATCPTTFSAEGDPVVRAIYSGTSAFATSSGTVTQQVDMRTTVSANTFTNSGAITLNNPTTANPQPATPYASHITASNLGPVTGLTVTLHGVSYPFAQDLNALLVGPSGQSLILLGNVGPSTGTTNAANVTVTFNDSAASTIPQGTPLGSPGSTVTTKPVDYAATDQFPSPAPIGPYGFPAPKGSNTLGSTFDTTNPDGTWSLYLVTDGAGDGTGSVSGGWTLSFTVASQAVVFTSPAPTNAVVGGPTYTPTATGGASGNPVVLSIDASATSVCSIAGGVVSFTGAGSCVIDANQAGNANYNAAPQAQQTFTVGKGAQAITFTSTAPTTAVVGGPTYTPTATGGASGSPVTFSIDASATSVCSIAGGVVSFTGAGSCVIDANQAGNANFNAAPQAQQTFTVGKGAQAITFTSTAPTTAAVGGPTYTPTATGGASGSPVTFSIDASATSVCSIAGGVVSFTGAGSCVIDANQAGNANFNAAPQAQQTFTVGKGAQAITFTSTAPTNAVVGGPTYTPTATGGASGNPVTFSIDASATSVCSIAGGVVSFTGAGSCVIDANQAGNANFNAAPQAQQTFTVGKGAQAITFTSTAPTTAVPGGPTYTPTATGGPSGNPVIFSIDASATSVCSITGGVVSFTGAGSCVIDANQAGNANFNPAPQARQTVTVGKRAQTITFTSKAPTGAVIGGPTYTPTATGGASGNPVIFSIDASATSVCSIAGGVITFTAAGSCVIDANQAGNANYNPAPRVQQAVSVMAALAAPTGLTATAGVGQIKLSWNAVAGHGGPSATGYRVYRGTSPGGESANPLATLPAGQTSFTDAAVTPGVTYYYVVRAFNAAGSSAPSAEAHATVTASAAGGARLAVKPDRTGYWVLQPGGAVRAFGTAVNYGSLVGQPTNEPVVGMAATPDGRGYWLVASDGGVFTFGDAGFLGSTGGVRLNEPVVGMAATPDGRGYWLVASDGGVFTFGDAGFLGSTGGVRLNKPIVGMEATPDGRGYWLVASDGGVFTFGDAGFLGSTGGVPLNKPIVGMEATPDGRGYWLVASDGGVFTFGDAGFFGSTAGSADHNPVVGLYSSLGGHGYSVVDSAGRRTTFGT